MASHKPAFVRAVLSESRELWPLIVVEHSDGGARTLLREEVGIVMVCFRGGHRTLTYRVFGSIRSPKSHPQHS